MFIDDVHFITIPTQFKHLQTIIQMILMGMQMWVPAYKMFHVHSTSKQYIIDKNRNRHCFQTNHMKIWQHKRTNHQTASTIEMMFIPIIQVVAEIFSFRFARFLCAFSTLSVFDLFSLFRVSWYASCLYGWVHDSQRKVQQYNNLQHIKIYCIVCIQRDFVFLFNIILFSFCSAVMNHNCAPMYTVYSRRQNK